MELLQRNLLPLSSPVGRNAVTVVPRSANPLKRMALAVPSSPLITSVRIRISRCIHAEDKAKGESLDGCSQYTKRWQYINLSALLQRSIGAPMH
jgi:hypothetical protein